MCCGRPFTAFQFYNLDLQSDQACLAVAGNRGGGGRGTRHGSMAGFPRSLACVEQTVLWAHRLMHVFSVHRPVSMLLRAMLCWESHARKAAVSQSVYST